MVSEAFCALACSGAPMMGHVSDDNLLGGRIPRIVDAEAASRISGVPAIFDVPVGRISIALPIEVEGIISAVGVANAFLNRFVSDRAFSSVYSRGPALVG